MAASAAGFVGVPAFSGSAVADSTSTLEFQIEQDGEVKGCITPLTYSDDDGMMSIDEFYNYCESPPCDNKDNDGGANTPTEIEQEGYSILFFYEDGDGVSLVMIHDDGDDKKENTEDFKQTTFTIDGLPSGDSWVVQEDRETSEQGGSDEYSIDSGTWTIDWDWRDKWSDGGAFGYLDDDCDEELSITIDPDFSGWPENDDLIDPFEGWKALSGPDADSPNEIELGDSKPVTITCGCSTTFELCADQDTNVGAVTVTDRPGDITITYETTGGWELYETHVDIGDEPGDFPTNNGGNPKVGQFDLSGTHDGMTTVSYTVECGDDALSDVTDYSELLIAAHAVVKPTDGCADFSTFGVGDSVEGLGTVSPVLNIESISSVSGAEAVAQKEGQKPGTYGAPNGSGTVTNGCLDDFDQTTSGGFSDLETKNAQGSHAYRFTFAEGVSVSDFELRMLDFGDLNAKNKTDHKVVARAYNEAGDKVDSQMLKYTTNDATNPTDWTPVEGTSKTNDDLQEAGDACDAAEGEPGNYLWSLSGDAIVKVELEVMEGTDPNIAFTDLCFTTNDETAWPCEQENVTPFNEEGGNWATYIEYETSLFDC